MNQEGNAVGTGPCPCCTFPIGIAAIVGLLVLAKIAQFAFMSNKNKAGWISWILKWIVRITFFLTIVIAVFLGVMSRNENIRSRLFAKLMTTMNADGKMVEERCGLLKTISGKVLEFGPGPGTNFRCMSDRPIDSWTGVEPNTHFSDAINSEKLRQNITFETKTVWLNGNNVDVDVNSFDAVLATHVLCSIADIEQIMKQVDRALKPGGTFYFMEHVAGPEGSNLRILQSMLAPFFYIVGNGCEFKETWNNIKTSPALSSYEINMNHFDADILAPMRPHIIGTARKPGRI